MLTDRHDIRYALPMNTRMNIELPAFKDNGHLFRNGVCRGLLLLAIVRGKTVGTFKTVTLTRRQCINCLAYIFGSVTICNHKRKR